jgi:hypothetical protein
VSTIAANVESTVVANEVNTTAKKVEVSTLKTMVE